MMAVWTRKTRAGISDVAFIFSQPRQTDKRVIPFRARFDSFPRERGTTHVTLRAIATLVGPFEFADRPPKRLALSAAGQKVIEIDADSLQVKSTLLLPSSSLPLSIPTCHAQLPAYSPRRSHAQTQPRLSSNASPLPHRSQSRNQASSPAPAMPYTSPSRPRTHPNTSTSTTRNGSSRPDWDRKNGPKSSSRIPRR